ncbi:MAG: MFS transporter [Henriciella sp.]|nr:MFS transporter [Henriciella sp.]
MSDLMAPANEPGLTTAAAAPVTGGALGKKGLGWAIFEWARNPYYNAIVISVFAAYFATEVIGDPVRGQALVARTILIAGLLCAVTMPILGAMIDIGGRRKPVTFIALSVLAITSCLLWFIKPGVPGSVLFGMTLMVIGYVSYTIAELLHNSMLNMAGKPSALPYISGLGLALGNLAGTGVLLILLFVFALPGDPNGPLAASEVPFGLDRAEFEHQRITGPLVGAWIAIFIAPFFLFMPDIKQTPTRTWKRAAATLLGSKGIALLLTDAASHVREMFKEHPNVMRFLVGRMIYADGIAALLTIGTVFVAGLLGWSLVEILAVSVIGTLGAVCGALTAGYFDRRLGPKISLMMELSGLIILLLLQLSISKEAILYGLIPSIDPVWNGPIFTSLSDMTYVCLVIPASFLLGACISSSRYMLVHIAPPHQIGQFFGFYAMAGSVTIWLGPGLVDVMTTVSGNQRIGMSGLAVLFIIGLAIISTVKADKTPTHLQADAPD